MTWGIIYLCLGMTIMLRNQYNPFADPVITIFILMISVAVYFVKLVMDIVSNYLRIWEVSYHTVHKVDVSEINKLDKEYGMRVLVKNL